MGDAGFFRGTSSDQDGRFSDKEKKLLKQMKFENTLDRKINMDKINLDVIKPWITMRINDILGIEDDVVIEYIMSQLEEKDINPKIMQINITGFLNARRAREFMGELWALLVEADEAEDGIPRSLVEKKIEELRKEPRPGNGDVKPEPTPQSEDWATRYSSLSGGRYTGPTKEKEVPDDRITKISPRGGTPPRRRRENRGDDTPPRRRAYDDRDRERERERDRDRERDREREQRRQQRIEDERKREEESKKREEERLKRRAEERERERRRDEERAKERERRRAEERERERRRRKSRSRSRSRSPVKRRFTETTSSSKRKRSPSTSSTSSSEEERKKKKASRRKYRSSTDESDYEKKSKKEKKAKKHKKEKKKKEKKRSPTPSSTSLSDTE